MDGLVVLGPVALLLAAYLIYRFRVPAARLGLVDLPGGRKRHEGEIPLVGGVGIFVAFAFTALLIDGSLQPYRPLFAGMGLLLITGVLDDLEDLGATEKILLQICVALLLIFWGDLRIFGLGDLPLIGPVELGMVAVPFTLLCVVGLINAINMLDGSDGLAGGVVAVILFWFAVVGVVAADHQAMMLPALMAFAVLGFLAFNMPTFGGRRARVFLGDSGSTMLGFAAGWFAIELAFNQGTGVPPVTIAWILTLPIFDTIVLMLRRLSKGQNPMTPDREHLHHIFERAGFGPAATAYICIGLAFLFGGIGVGSWWLNVPQEWMWPPLLMLFVLHALFVQRAWQAVRMLRRLHL